jgi:phage-related protein
MVDLTTAIGLLGNAGIKGSDAGTSLKQALLQLTGPSDKAKGLMQELAASIGVSGDIAYTAEGRMRSFEEILGLTAQATAGLTDEKRNQYITDIFGADASRAILILMKQGPDAWAKMTEAVTRQGAAQELAAAQTKGFHGAVEGAKSQLETLQLVIGSALLPVLAMLLNTYISPAIAAFTSWTESIMGASDPLLFLASALHGVSAPLGSIAFYLVELLRGGEGVNAWLAATPPLFQTLVGAIQSAVTMFQQADTSVVQLQTVFQSVWDAILGHTQMVWNTIGQYIPFIMQAVSSIVQSVLAIIGAFWQQHGAEVMAFIQTTWSQIEQIYNTALHIVLTLVTIVLEGLATFIQQHGDDITTILSGAWQMISNLIQGALTLIQGILTAALAVLRGDWDGAWEAIMMTVGKVAQNIIGFVGGLLETVAGLFGTSMSEIGSMWSSNWDLLVQIVQKIPSRLAGVGQAIVNMIKSGFEGAWNGFMSSVNAKLAALRDMLPFSEPRDHTSPLYGLGKSGAAIVDMLQRGIDGAPSLQIGGAQVGEMAGARAGGMASPIASAGQIAAGARGTTHNYYGQVGNCYQMPVYTSQSPQVIGQSFAIAQAMSFG